MASVTILPEHYINRELSWLEFNHRVMMQAVADENPVFERIKFLSIVTSNLDEFFMVRVASVRDQLPASVERVCVRKAVAVQEFERSVVALRHDEIAVDLSDLEKLRRDVALWIDDSVHAERTVIRLFVEIAAICKNAQTPAICSDAVCLLPD